MTKLRADLVEQKLREADGNMAAVGRAFGVTRQAVSKFIASHPSLQSVLTECRETMKDEVESALYTAAKNGEGWAVCFYLKTQAKDRGYIEKREHEHTGPDGGAIPISFIEFADTAVPGAGQEG